MRQVLKILAWTFASFIIVGLLVVCISGVLKSVDTPTNDSLPSPAEVSRRLSETPAPSPNATPDGNSVETAVPVKYGQTYRWNDGLRIKVSSPKPYQLEEGVVGKYKHYIIFTVTVISSAVYTEEQFIERTVTTRTGLGEQYYGEGTGWPDRVFKGRPSTFKVVYGVPDMKDVEFSLNPCIFPESPNALMFEYVTWK